MELRCLAASRQMEAKAQTEQQTQQAAAGISRLTEQQLEQLFQNHPPQQRKELADWCVCSLAPSVACECVIRMMSRQVSRAAQCTATDDLARGRSAIGWPTVHLACESFGQRKVRRVQLAANAAARSPCHDIDGSTLQAFRQTVPRLRSAFCT